MATSNDKKGQKLLIWKRLRRMKDTFTSTELAAAAGCHRRRVNAYLAQLEKAGYLTTVGRGIGRYKQYSLIVDPGLYPPLWRDGVMIDANLERSGIARYWQAARILRVFDRPTIEAVTELPRSACQTYSKQLRRAGYLLVLTNADGSPGVHSRYQLLRDTGPYHPLIGRSGCWDPNTEEFTPYDAEERGRHAS